VTERWTPGWGWHLRMGQGLLVDLDQTPYDVADAVAAASAHLACARFLYELEAAGVAWPPP
jgi:hypothetical protein